ncbi:MAG: gamma-glutamyltransferase family protein, partial [Planctomycetota bacterium]
MSTSQPESTADFQTLSTRLPYDSRRQPVLGTNMVATSHPLAAQAGLEILRKGGNAIDAAVATAMALTVLEPSGNGIGSDNFALIWTGGGIHGLNSSGQSPALMTPDRYSGQERIGFAGYDGVTTPGAPAGWIEAVQNYGIMSMREVAEPAIRYARNGHPLAPGVGRSYAGVLRRYQTGVHQGFFDTFSTNGPSGKEAPRPGDWKVLADHADTLQAIAETDGREFYAGDFARRLDAHSREFGGAIRGSDLERHESDWVRPMHIDYHGWRLHEIPPNGQGMTALIALGILRRFDIASMEPDDPDCLHIQIEAMKLAFRDADRYIADPRYMDIDPPDLLREDYLESRARLIDRSRAQDFDHGTPKTGGTVLLTTADDRGNMVSFIQSNYTGFGSGVVVPGTGVSLQNRGACFVLDEGHPNRVGPNKRPYHTIIPGFVTTTPEPGKPERPVMTFGVMGGFMQHQGHQQVMCRMLHWNQNAHAEPDATRWQVKEGLEVD